MKNIACIVAFTEEQLYRAKRLEIKVRDPWGGWNNCFTYLSTPDILESSEAYIITLEIEGRVYTLYSKGAQSAISSLSPYSI